jgi:lysozyme
MNYRATLRAQLVIDEGVRAKPYRDSVGKVSIGRGRNLDDVGLRPDEIEYLFKNDFEQAIVDAKALFQSFDRLTPNRKSVLANMVFNLGRAKLAGFARLRAAVAAKDWAKAEEEMIDSLWALQVGKRADRLATLMKKG